MPLSAPEAKSEIAIAGCAVAAAAVAGYALAGPMAIALVAMVSGMAGLSCCATWSRQHPPRRRART